jgi:hypothetical protein
MSELVISPPSIYALLFLCGILFGGLFGGIVLLLVSTVWKDRFPVNGFTRINRIALGLFLGITCSFSIWKLLSSDAFTIVRYDDRQLVLYPQNLRSPTYLSWQNIVTIEQYEYRRKWSVRNYITVSTKDGRHYDSVAASDDTEKANLSKVLEMLRKSLDNN